MADEPTTIPPGTEVTVYWCPRCRVQSERMFHFCERGPAMFPQLDKETHCVELKLTVPEQQSAQHLQAVKALQAMDMLRGVAGTLETETGLWGRDAETQVAEYERRIGQAVEALRDLADRAQAALGALPDGDLQSDLLAVFERHGVSVAVGQTKDGVAIRSQDERVDALNLGEVEAFDTTEERDRLREPYHECVSLTYVGPESAMRSLLRIRRRLKMAIGWWTDHDEQLERAALSEELPEHLREDAPFVVCDGCGRHSWGLSAGDQCNMPQPDGSRCQGLFRDG